jgi:hypothetical protein
MLFHIHEPATFTPSSGAYSVKTLKFTGALLRHVYITSTTANTKFDFSLTDEEGREFINMDGNVGCLNREYQIPLIGVYTITISNASVDEPFKMRFAVEDSI